MQTYTHKIKIFSYYITMKSRRCAKDITNNRTRRYRKGGTINKEIAAAKKAAKEAEKAAKKAAKEAEKAVKKATKEAEKVAKEKARVAAKEERMYNRLVAMEMEEARKEEERENRIIRGLPVKNKRANEKSTYDKLVELEMKNASPYR